MTYLLFKSLHLVSMVAWFAGLFYIIRLFVYHTEAWEKSPEESRILSKQYHIMESRLFRIIIRPAMLLTWIFGIALICTQGIDWFKAHPWLHVKLLLVFLLSGYSDYCGKMISQLERGEKIMTSYQLRLYNEVPTLFLLTIVLLAVYKNLLNFGYTFVGIVLFALLLVLMTRIYKKLRLRK